MPKDPKSVSKTPLLIAVVPMVAIMAVALLAVLEVFDPSAPIPAPSPVTYEAETGTFVLPPSLPQNAFGEASRNRAQARTPPGSPPPHPEPQA